MSQQKAGKYACYEFERKFLIPELLPSLQYAKDFKQIEDRYFPETNLRLRIVRNSDGKVTERKLTQKYVPEGSSFAKTVITNIYLTEKDAALFDGLSGLVLRKNRYQLKNENYTFSIDQFVDSANLILAEVEFESEAEMQNFALPFADWKEVTHEQEYSGGYLASVILARGL
ncbi:MAG: hypothetical protein ACXWC9_05100 [Pseudobdellovibrionaceae bacterium]